MVKEESLTIAFDVNEIARVSWFGFMDDIMSNGNNFELYLLFKQCSNLSTKVIFACLGAPVMQPANSFDCCLRRCRW